MKREGLIFYLTPEERVRIGNANINDLTAATITEGVYPGIGSESTVYEFSDPRKANAFEEELSNLGIKQDFILLNLRE